MDRQCAACREHVAVTSWWWWWLTLAQMLTGIGIDIGWSRLIGSALDGIDWD